MSNGNPRADCLPHSAANTHTQIFQRHVTVPEPVLAQ
jgi:hypothetical protein